ncbi:MauE/DoxX family redox-associated membrane protein [Priestia flexa]|uniref:MauE/DoxX family redox-associated membrane protein n=1 Tax=Priestia flexa TaxID=86664 RepID=UPI003D94FE95
MVKSLVGSKVNILKKNIKISLKNISLYCSLVFISIIMLYSGITKFVDVFQFINTLSYYKYIPNQLHVIIGYIVPILEVLIGLLIWHRPLRNYMLFTYKILIFSFILLLIIHYGSYMPYGCGCLGTNDAETIDYLIILRDGICIIPAYIYSILAKQRIFITEQT